MTENQVPRTRLCKCGKEASVIKDYWITESKIKRDKLEDDAFTEKVECVCGIVRRRFCPACLSKLADRQIRLNRRLNLIILISIFVPLALLTFMFGYNYFALSDASALVPFVIVAAFTVLAEALLSFRFVSVQMKRARVKNGDVSDLHTVDALLDSLNFGLEDYKKIKEIPSTDIVSDGEGRVNYEMERSGFNMRVMLNGRINIEPMTERMKYPFKDEAEYVKRTYVNAGLFEDNMRPIDERELSEKDFDIKNGALLRYSGLAVNVTIPENVTAIGVQAFKNSKNCENIVVPDAVSVIEKEAFSGCPASAVNLPSALREIKAFTFYHSGIKEAVIPEGVESIGENAFCECYVLERVVIPASCKKVATNAFKGCSALASLEIGEGVESLGDYSFNGCSSLKTIVIPEGVYEVGNFAFEGCTSLEALYLPDSIQFMGGRAFEGNINMTIYGKFGSYAEQYATEQRKRFESTDEKKKIEHSTRAKKS